MGILDLIGRGRLAAVLVILGGVFLPALAGSAETGAPVGDTWRWIPPTTVLGARQGQLQVWTGNELLVWGGDRTSGRYTTHLNDGARFDPATGAWRPLPSQGAPVGRFGEASAWTGSQLLVWGGDTGRTFGQPMALVRDGARYDLASDRWLPMSSVGAPSARIAATAVWTGTELLIWGGRVEDMQAPPRALSDGAAYNPAADTWRPLASTGAPAGRSSHAAVWTGREMLVWGGWASGGTPLGDGARYDPVADRWTPMAAAGAPSPRAGHVAAWSGREVLIWGGQTKPWQDADPGSRPTDAAAYDPASGAWRPISSRGVPPPLDDAQAFWTGSEMLLFGVPVGAPMPTPYHGPLPIGARYDPRADAWSSLPSAGGPWGGRAAWTGRELVVWGFSTEKWSSGPGEGALYVPPDVEAPPLPTAPPVAHDERYFPETRYRIDDDAIWRTFLSRGQVETFGYPVSRPFVLEGCRVQFFQRLVAQVCEGREGVALLNLLDPEFFPYSPDGGTRLNGSTFPAPDETIKRTTPAVADPDYAGRILDFVRQTVPDEWENEPVRFGETFFGLVTAEQAGTDEPALLGLLNLEVWGAPNSLPMRDPNNADFVYQRFQRGIMHYDRATGVTRGILLADAFKQVLRDSAELPPDLRGQALGSRFFAQYCPNGPRGLCRVLEMADLRFAFEEG